MMKKSSLIKLATLGSLIILITGDARAETSSSSLACPPHYALSITPPPPPTDDPANRDSYKPQTAAEKLQAQEQAKANEMSRWHCVPLNELHSQQPQQPAGDYDEQ